MFALGITPNLVNAMDFDMIYDLWDTSAGNIINTYETEAQALAMVRDLIEANGAAFAEALSLGYESDVGASGIVAEGRALEERARATAGTGEREGVA